MPKIANAIGSIPKTIAIGAKIGTVSKIIETLSINIPSTIQTKIINAMICQGSKPAFKNMP